MFSQKRNWIQATAAAGVCGLILLGLSSGVAADDAKPAPINVGGVNQAGGTIKGVIKFNGKEVTRKKIDQGSDPNCVTAHGADSPALEEKFVFGKDHTLQNVLVYVSKGLEGKTFPMPATPPHMDQVGCVYVPHVRAIVAGEELVIKNSDNTTHNVHVWGKANGDFNKSMLQGMVLNHKFDHPEMAIPVKCDVHTWMIAYLHVMSNPFFAITQEDGSFEIKGLPPGDYELSFWHEFDRFAPDKEHVTVTIKGNETQEVSVTYAPVKK